MWTNQALSQPCVYGRGCMVRLFKSQAIGNSIAVTVDGGEIGNIPKCGRVAPPHSTRGPYACGAVEAAEQNVGRLGWRLRRQACLTGGRDLPRRDRSHARRGRGHYRLRKVHVP
jgi:hypothetical protein